MRLKITPRKNKFGNVARCVDGIRFDSQREALRYLVIKLMLRAGEISDLAMQEEFVIAPECVYKGTKQRARKYRADFSYTVVATGARVVEDCKGHRTAEYLLKRHLMVTVHGIEVKET